MQPGSGIADLRTGHKRRTIQSARSAHRAAHGLRNVFIRLEVGIRTRRSEALDRAHHYPWIDLVDLLPRKTEPVEHARAEVLHDDVCLLYTSDAADERSSVDLGGRR